MAKRLTEGAVLYKSLEDKIRAHTFETTKHYDVGRTKGRHDDSPLEVYPRLEVVDFYGSYLEPEDEYIPESELDRFASPRRSHIRENVGLEKLFSDFRQGHMTFIGPAGSGKTTLLKSIARNVAGRSSTYLKEIDFVHFLEGRNVCSSEIQTPMELLLHEADQSFDPREIEEYASMISKSPGRVLIVVDSLDTIPCALEDERQKIGTTDKAPVRTILWNLLTSNLFPGSRVITSSREHAIRKYEGKLRAQKVVALGGLTLESINKITNAYFEKERAREILEYLQKNTPALMKLCSTPVFLAFTLNGFDNKSAFKPKTMTGVLIQVLRNLIRSPNAKAGNLEEILVKLARFAFSGTRQGKVLFDHRELETHDLKEEEISDLTVVVPKGEPRRLLHNESYLYFSHQSIQEMLTASYISRMTVDRFEEFIEREIHSPRYSVVRRLLCGLLLDTDVKTIAEEIFGDTEGATAKCKALKRSMETLLEQKFGPTDTLEQMMSFHEGLHGLKDIVFSHLNEAIFHGIVLSRSDAHVIGSVLSQASNLTFFALRDCNLTPEVVVIISSLLEGSQLKITRFQVSDNKNMQSEGIYAVGEIAKSCAVGYLDVGDCDLTSDLAKVLEKSLNGAQVSQMLLRENKNLGQSGMSTLGNIVTQSGVEKLGLGGCDPTTEELRAFRSTAKGVKLKSLVLNRVLPHTPTRDEVKEIAELISMVTGELRLLGWNIDRKDRLFFRQKIQESQPSLRIVLDDNDILSMNSEPSGGPSQKESFHSRNLIAKTDVRQIGPEGGSIKVGNCEISFPPNAVSISTRFRVSLSILPAREPDENLRITPLVTCVPSMKFPVPVKVKLPTWCWTMSNNVITYVMAQESDEQEPYQFASAPLKGTHGIIEFETFHFTGFWAFVRRLVFGELRYKVVPSLHFNAGSGNLSTVFHVNDPVMAENCRKVLSDGGFQRCPVMLDTITVKAGDDIKVTLRCLDPETHYFDPDDEQGLRVEEDFAEEDTKNLAFIFTPKPVAKQELKISIKIDPYDVKEKKFRLVWPDTDSDGRDVHFYGSVQAENIVL